jgi:hypothetical protein
MIVCSAISAVEIPHAWEMAKSVKEHMPNAKVVICLVEKTMHPTIQECPYFDKVLLAKDLSFQWPSFDRIIFKYNAKEGISSLKGQLLFDLYTIYAKEDYFFYIDAKMKIMSPCSELLNMFDHHSILFTPVQLYPSCDIDHEHELLNEGTFDNGFIGLKRSENTTKFFEWFSERLTRFYEDPYKGQEIDKKFLNLAMAGFDVYIIRHPGYNVGVWNLHERKMTTDANGKIFVLGNPLRIFNYKGLESWQIESKETKLQIDESTWSYDFFHSGEKISRETKVHYRQNVSNYDSFGDLFAESNESLASAKKIKVEGDHTP